MSRDVVRYILTFLVPLRLLLALPGPSASVAPDRLVGQAHQNPLKFAECRARPLLAAELTQAPASRIAFTANEFSEKEEDSQIITNHEVSDLDDRPSESRHPERRCAFGIRQESRNYPLRC